MTSAAYPLTIKQGVDWRHTVELSTQLGQPLPFTVVAARMEVRATFADPEPLVAISSDEGGIEIVSPTGVIQLALSISSDVTLSLPALPMVYDLFLIDDAGEASCPLQGPLRLIQRVTHLP